MFGAPISEAESQVIKTVHLQPFRGIGDMYNTLVPGDPMFTGLPYGGNWADPRFRSWQRQALEGVTTDAETTRWTDFKGILLEVVGEVAAARWETMDRSYLKLVEIGPAFNNYIDSNVVVSGASPDMKEWDEETGYPTMETGKKQSVTSKVSDFGGILRWTKRMVQNDENGSGLQLILEDVAGAVEATWRVIGRGIINEVMGWSTGINTKLYSDGLPYYQSPDYEGGRANYINGNGASYDNMVSLLHLMLSQTDIAKAGQTPQPLVLVPGRVLCVNTRWKQVQEYFHIPFRPGSTTEPNELGLPEPPEVIGVHRSFLHGRDDFLGYLPNPLLKGTIRMQYYLGRQAPSIVWQNQSFAGQVFENGTISVQLDMPVRITTVRPKGLAAIYES